MPGSGDALASQKRAKGRPDKDYKSQKKSRYGLAQDRVKSRHDGGGKETRTRGTTPPSGPEGTRPAVKARRGGGWFEK